MCSTVFFLPAQVCRAVVCANPNPEGLVSSFTLWLLQGEVVGDTCEDGCATPSLGRVQSSLPLLFAVRRREVEGNNDRQ